jgi:hypothetical protein
MRAHGRAKVSTKSPRAFGICDRCGFLYNHEHLRFQFDWAGPTLKNKQMLVCRKCEDEYQEQLRTIVLPADPVPIVNPRTQNYSAAETAVRQTSGQNTTDFWTGIPIPDGDTRVTQNNQTRVTQQTGEPPGGLNTEPGTDPNTPGNSDPGLPYGNVEVPKTGPL